MKMIKGTKFILNSYLFFILGSQYNKVNLFLINLFKSGNKGLNSVKNKITLKSTLILGCHAVSVEILATSQKLFTDLV